VAGRAKDIVGLVGKDYDSVTVGAAEPSERGGHTLTDTDHSAQMHTRMEKQEKP